MTTKTETIEGAMAEYVTAMIGGQLFGLPISRVQDVFMPERLTRVPLSSARDRRRAQSARPHRHRGRHARPARAAQERRRQAADGGRRRSARRVLRPLIDQIGEVLRLPDDGREENPVNLDPRMAKLAGGVHRLDGQLMVVLDVDRVLEIVPKDSARRVAPDDIRRSQEEGQK